VRRPGAEQHLISPKELAFSDWTVGPGSVVEGSRGHPIDREKCTRAGTFFGVGDAIPLENSGRRSLGTTRAGSSGLPGNCEVDWIATSRFGELACR